MIKRLRKVTDGLYRGSAPSIKDLQWLKEHLGIKKVVSLDRESGDRIERACKLLGIQQVKAYIDHDRKSLYKVLSHNLKNLLIDGGPTYLHCHEGKDRTGLLSALYKCKYMGVSPTDALQEAKSLGFGVGVPPKVVRLYEKLIKSCGSNDKDTNHADIVSNERDYIGDNRDTFLDEMRQDSFAPYLDHTRQNPADALYVYVNDQAPTRQNYRSEKDFDFSEVPPNGIPNVGQYDNDAGQRGFGPVEEINGWFSEVGH